LLLGLSEPGQVFDVNRMQHIYRTSVCSTDV
ncbi:MAG: hypothetical protein ACI8RE_002120, partial [Ilumatobacter sp.]